MAQARRLHDRFFKQAKEEGYAARSAYKLKQIQEKRRVIRRGDRVLDLGCAPGSWVQVACELVGADGRVAGIDLKPVEIPLPENARTMAGDIFKTEATTLRQLATDDGSDTLFDVVLSDMAPSTEGGGGGSADHFRSVDLCRRVLELTPALLRSGGNLVMKVFEGEAYPALLRDTGRMFEEVKGFKPEASREVSREMYILATGFKGQARPHPAHNAETPAPPRPAPGPGWAR